VSGYRIGVHSQHAKTWRKQLDIADDAEIPNEQKFDYRILIIGQTGAGKSCLITNIARSVDAELRMSTAISNDGGEGTDILEPYEFKELPLTLLDTRGLFFYDPLELKEVRNLVDGKYKDFEVIVRKRKQDGKLIFDQTVEKRPTAEFKDQIHGVIFVFKSIDPYLKNGTYFEQYRPIRTFMRRRGMQPIVCITWADKMATADVTEIRRQAVAATGCDKDRMYEIVNAQNSTQEVPTPTKVQVFKMLHECLVFCEKYHLSHYTRVKNGSPLEVDDDEAPEPGGRSKSTISKDPSGVELNVRVLQGEKVLLSVSVPPDSDMTFRMLKNSTKQRNKALPLTDEFFLKDDMGKDCVDDVRIASQYKGLQDVDLYVHLD